MVEDVEGFKANLELGLTIDVEGPEDARVEDGGSGSAELVPAGVGQRGDAFSGCPPIVAAGRPGWRRRKGQTMPCRR